VRVAHTGRIVRGRGAIRVSPHAGGSRVVWAEELRPPFGPLGRVLWPVIGPIGAALVRGSLRALATLAARAEHPERTGR